MCSASRAGSYSKPPSSRQSRFASVGLWCLCACRVFVRVFCVGVVCLWRVVLCVCMRCVEQLWRRDGRRPTRASATHGQLEMDVYSIRRVGDSKCILITVGHRWRGTRGVWNMEGARAGVGLGKSRGPNHLSSQPASKVLSRLVARLVQARFFTTQVPHHTRSP